MGNGRTEELPVDQRLLQVSPWKNFNVGEFDIWEAFYNNTRDVFEIQFATGECYLLDSDFVRREGIAVAVRKSVASLLPRPTSR